MCRDGYPVLFCWLLLLFFLKNLSTRHERRRIDRGLVCGAPRVYEMRKPIPAIIQNCLGSELRYSLDNWDAAGKVGRGGGGCGAHIRIVAP